MGLVALQLVESSSSKDQTHATCIGRQILNPWTTRNILPMTSYGCNSINNMERWLLRENGSFLMCIVTHFLGWHNQAPVTLRGITYTGNGLWSSLSHAPPLRHSPRVWPGYLRARGLLYLLLCPQAHIPILLHFTWKYPMLQRSFYFARSKLKHLWRAKEENLLNST